MPWSIDGPDRLEAVAYTGNYSAQAVLGDVQTGDTADFSAEPSYISYYSQGDYKVYKVTITIEPVDG